VDAIGHFARSRQKQRGWPPDEDRGVERPFHPPCLLPLDGKMLRRHIGGATDAIFRFDHAAIDAEIVRAGLGISRHPDARGNEGSGIVSGRRNQMWKSIYAAFELRSV